MNSVEIFTDGACRGNPGPGGWGVLLQWNGRSKTLCGGVSETTNNRMELTAAIMALEALRRPCRVILYTDSSYVQQGLTRWLPAWRSRGWRTAGKKAVRNQDLWQRLETAAARHNIDWRWVKGHAGHAGNETADRLANQGLAEALNRRDSDISDH